MNTSCPALVAITIGHPFPASAAATALERRHRVVCAAQGLMQAAERAGARLTFMAEMDDYLRLLDSDPPAAAGMQSHLQDAVRRGHDVQLQVELSPGCRIGGVHREDARSEDAVPGELARFLRRLRGELESLLQPAAPRYRAVAFRERSHRVQPFRGLFEALVAGGFLADSSVYAGGFSAAGEFDFRLAYRAREPWFANPWDPQLKAPPADSRLLELPVATFAPGRRWRLDDPGGPGPFVAFDRVVQQRWSQAVNPSRVRARLRNEMILRYQQLARWRRRVNRLLPRAWAHRMAGYQPEQLVAREYCVMTGDLGGPLDLPAIEADLRRLRDVHGVEYITLSEMVLRAGDELRGVVRNTPEEEAAFQVRREYRAVMGEERNAAQSYRLQEMVPRRSRTLLDLGCGAGYWSERLKRLYPWLEVTGLDCGSDFIEKARSRYGSSGCRFVTGDFAAMPFDDETFDCVYADNTLEHAFDPSQVLREAHRVLRAEGVLIAAVPSDARNPAAVCDSHTWKTMPHEVRLRFEDAGYVDVAIDEIDTYRELGMSPYPPSLDRMMYVRARKRGGRAAA